MGILFILSMLLPAPQALAQTTCFTDHTGSTLCSSPGGVIQGNTNSIGNSIFRDSSGNRLDYDSDTTGKSSLQLPSGESIRWYEPVPEQPGVPQLIELRKRSPAGMDAVIPGNAPLAPVPEFPAPP